MGAHTVTYSPLLFHSGSFFSWGGGGECAPSIAIHNEKSDKKLNMLSSVSKQLFSKEPSLFPKLPFVYTVHDKLFYMCILCFAVAFINDLIIKLSHSNMKHM